MTSKEALKSMCNHCEKISIRDGFIGCPYRNISNDYCEEFETIRKDLEVLDIIKRSIYSKEIHKYVMNEKLKGQKFMSIGLSIRGDTDIDKVKEWLEDEN